MSDPELSDDKGEGRRSTAGSYTKTLPINLLQCTNISHGRPRPSGEEKGNNKMRTGSFSDHKDSGSPTPRSNSPECHLQDEDKDKNKKKEEESEHVYPGWRIIIPVMLSLYTVLFLVALVSL